MGAVEQECIFWWESAARRGGCRKRNSEKCDVWFLRMGPLYEQQHTADGCHSQSHPSPSDTTPPTTSLLYLLLLMLNALFSHPYPPTIGELPTTLNKCILNFSATRNSALYPKKIAMMGNDFLLPKGNIAMLRGCSYHYL